MVRWCGFFLVIVLAAGCGKGSGSRADSGALGNGGRDAGTPADAASFRDGPPRDARFVLDTSVAADTRTGAGGGDGDARIGGSGGAAIGGQGGNAGNPSPDAGAGGAPPSDAGGASDAGGTGGAIVATGLTLFTGAASLLDQGPSCTGEAGATGDRWCAFVAPSGAGAINLFVVNVSRAIAGTPVACGTDDANCLLLTGAFDEPDNLHAALFQGDTLVYFDSTGTPWAWRPGMASSRRLAVVSTTTGDVLLCRPSVKGTAIMCLRDLPTQSNPNLVQSDLLAGRVDGTADPPLARIETVISANAADTDVARFAYGFPAPGSGTIAWSSRATASGPEILKAQQVDNAASRAMVATDVHGWDVSPDGARWYWLSRLNGTTGAGTLQSAPFPGGAGPTNVMTNAVQFGFPTPTSLVVLNTAMALSGIANPAGAPTRLTAIDTGVIGFLGASGDGHVSYVKTFDGTSLTDLFVRKWDATGATCTLTSAVDAVFASVQFSLGSGAAVWARSNAAGGFDAMYTRLADCGSASVAPAVAAVAPVGDSAVLFMDQLDTTAGTGSLRFRGIDAGGALDTAAPTLIAAPVGTFDLAGAVPGAVIYTVNSGGAGDGVYLRPFGP